MKKQYELVIKTSLNADGVKKGGKEVEAALSAIERAMVREVKRMNDAMERMPASMRRIFMDQSRFAETSYAAQSRFAQASALEQLRIAKSTSVAHDKLLEQSTKAEQRAHVTTLTATQKTSRDKLRIMQQAEAATERSTEAHVRKVNSILGRIGSGLRTAQNVLRGNASGLGDSGFLPGLANISQIIQGLPQIGQLAGALVRPLTDAAETGVRFNAWLETTRIGFETLLGSAALAQQHLDVLADFASKTPFQFQDLTGASQRMQAFGFSAKEVIPVLTAVGDALSATGEISKDALDGVLRQFGQIRSSGRVTAEDMNSITSHGIPAWDLLAKAIGKTVAETRKLSERGMLRGPEAVQAITAMMERRYGGQMTRVSNTYTGRLSNLEDIQQRAAGKATEGLTKNISDVFATGLAQENLVSKLAASINVAITPVAGMISAAASTLLGGSLTSGLVEGIGAGKQMVKDAVADFALDSIIGTAKSFLGIHSRSQVFYEIGGYSAQGFLEGMRDGLDNDKIGQYIQEAIRRGLNKAQAKSYEAMRKLFDKEPDFLPKLKAMAVERQMNPDHILNAMAVETSGTFNPAIKNPTSSASGLIQFMAQTARELGTTTEKLRAMTATQQLDYVFRYFDSRGAREGKLITQGAVYAAVGAGHAGATDSSVLMSRGDRGYAGNAATWDRNRDGLIQQFEFAAAAFNKLGAGIKFTVNGSEVSASNALPVIVIGQGWLGRDSARTKRQPGDIEGGNTGRLNKFIYTDGGESANALEFMRQINRSQEAFAVLNRVIETTKIDLAQLKDAGAPNFERGLRQQQQFDQFQLDNYGAPPEYGKALKAIAEVTAAEGSFYDSVVRKSKDAGETLKEVWKGITEQISQMPGNALEAFRSRGLKGAIASIRKDFSDLLFGLAKDYLQSSIYKLLHSDSTSSTSGGGLLGTIGGVIRSLFGGGRSKSGVTSPSTRGSGTSAVEQVTTAALSKVLSDQGATLNSSGGRIGGSFGFGMPGGKAFDNLLTRVIKLSPTNAATNLSSIFGNEQLKSLLGGVAIAAPQSLTAQSNWIANLASATGGRGWAGANSSGLSISSLFGKSAGGFGGIGAQLAPLLPLLGFRGGHRRWKRPWRAIRRRRRSIAWRSRSGRAFVRHRHLRLCHPCARLWWWRAL